ncbi:MAG: dethiobiotin synthase [Rickettsiales bacterium]|nr:dethiobiotin synthase [Rickettsiales bacterium]
MQKAYFVAAIGTDIGKTFLVENLCRILPNAMAIKPIASGFSEGDENSDSAKILSALSLKNSPQNLNSITPWRFEPAVSPHFAGKINFDEVIDFCQKKISEAKSLGKILFVEAAGGVMTPINYEKTFLDLAAELKISVLLVSANYLGAISHTLCAVEALKARGVVVEKIILNDELPVAAKSPNELITTLKNFTGIDTVVMRDFFKNFLD